MLAVVIAIGCTTDGYEADGDGNYSLLRADFALLALNSSGAATAFTTDDDRTLYLDEPVTVSTSMKDTLYRALVYYNETSTTTTTLRSLETVYVCSPYPEEELDEMMTDPAYFNSIWLSANGQYINLGIGLLTGYNAESTEKQAIAVVETAATETTHNLTFYHAQNSSPEYYTATIYVSIPTEGYFNAGDTINMCVNTYDGEVTKQLIIN